MHNRNLPAIVYHADGEAIPKNDGSEGPSGTVPGTKRRLPRWSAITSGS